MEKERKKKEKKGVPFKKKRFEYVLASHFYTKSKFSKLLFPDNADPLRKLQKYMEAEEIPREILEEIAQKLNVSPDYLKGEHTGNYQNDAYVYGKDRVFNDKFSYDDEGNYIPSYDDYQISLNSLDEREQIIALLNRCEWCYRKGDTEHDIKTKRFDFRRLDDFELRNLYDQITILVEELIMHPYNPNVDLMLYNPKRWETFVSDSLDEEERKLYKDYISKDTEENQ